MPKSSNAVGDSTALPALSGAGRGPPTPDAWQAVKEIVRRLYVEDELPLREVKAYLENHYGFRASERMFKDRLKKWSFTKNLTKEDWEALAVLHARRKTAGKRSTCFYVRERRKTIRDLQKYSRSQGVTEDTLAANVGAAINIPDYLRAATPETEDASPMTDSPSDRSPKSSLSPKQSPTTAPHSFISQTLAAIPAHQSSLYSSPTVNNSPRGLLLPDFEPHDRTFLYPGSGAASYFSHTSSGSASLAMTGSTMATSTHSDDPTSGRTAGTTSPWTFRPITSHTEDPLSTSWESDPISLPSSCDNISRDFEIMSHQLTDPAPVRSRYGADDITSWMLLDPPEQGQDPNDLICSCAVCHQPSAAHFVSIHNTIPQESRSILNDSNADRFGVPSTTKDEGAWRWIALCFASCLNMKKGNDNLFAISMADAATEFERLVSRRDRMLLTAANQTITILHQHNQGQIAATITASAKASTDRMLPVDDPIRITFNYLAATADSSISSASLHELGVTSSSLHSVYQALNADPHYGSQHPYTISASYNHAWLLRREGQFQEAEQRLHQIYATSCSIFGKYHMQSITAIATLAGSQSCQKKIIEAIANFKIAIRDCKPTLGKSHPYRLEAKRRLALQYADLGQDEKMLSLYWDVLTGRIHMLGRHHTYTLGMKEDYEQLMRKLGRWDAETQGEVEVLFGEQRTAEEEEATRRRRSGSDASRESECTAF